MSKKLKVKEKDFNLDPYLWRLVEFDGYPVAALYFNGREFSLSQEAMEDLSKIILDYIQGESGASTHMTSRDQYLNHLPENVFGRGVSRSQEEDQDSGCGHDHT